MRSKVGVRSISPGVKSRAAAALLAAAGDHPSGRYPTGGFRNRTAPTKVITRKIAPKIWKVAGRPYAGINFNCARGPKIAEPAPYPPTASPTASPRLSGNHLAITGIGVAYPNPFPSPPITPKQTYR